MKTLEDIKAVLAKHKEELREKYNIKNNRKYLARLQEESKVKEVI